MQLSDSDTALLQDSLFPEDNFPEADGRTGSKSGNLDVAHEVGPMMETDTTANMTTDYLDMDMDMDMDMGDDINSNLNIDTESSNSVTTDPGEISPAAMGNEGDTHEPPVEIIFFGNDHLQKPIRDNPSTTSDEGAKFSRDMYQYLSKHKMVRDAFDGLVKMMNTYMAENTPEGSSPPPELLSHYLSKKHALQSYPVTPKIYYACSKGCQMFNAKEDVGNCTFCKQRPGAYASTSTPSSSASALASASTPVSEQSPETSNTPAQKVQYLPLIDQLALLIYDPNIGKSNISVLAACIDHWNDYLKGLTNEGRLQQAFFTINHHYFTHTPELIRNMGPMNTYSTFANERTIGEYKRQIRSKKLPATNAANIMVNLAALNRIDRLRANDSGSPDDDRRAAKQAARTLTTDDEENSSELWGPIRSMSIESFGTHANANVSLYLKAYFSSLGENDTDIKNDEVVELACHLWQENGTVTISMDQIQGVQQQQSHLQQTLQQQRLQQQQRSQRQRHEQPVQKPQRFSYFAADVDTFAPSSSPFGRTPSLSSLDLVNPSSSLDSTSIGDNDFSDSATTAYQLSLTRSRIKQPVQAQMTAPGPQDPFQTCYIHCAIVRIQNSSQMSEICANNNISPTLSWGSVPIHLRYDAQLKLEEATSAYLPLRACIASWGVKLMLSKHWNNTKESKQTYEHSKPPLSLNIILLLSIFKLCNCLRLLHGAKEAGNLGRQTILRSVLSNKNRVKHSRII
ncbi:hypothetical protein BCR43DRAFT_513606 [Syncephalastrum racemosum]|uniref:Uncharacterized protein n=1 Tax=Syncephalastrum racemosum TaxID=13706 RepID=A0A1X2HDZ2_SYNRA|nr:hypothetical protein BCR43DRAFT_513606 [Syncephalastrum racemosum]